MAATKNRTKLSTPRTYSEVVAARICERLATGRESLREICNDNGMPSPDRVMAWVEFPDEEKRPGFVQRFIEARKIGWLLMGEDILDIADDNSNDIIKRKVRDRNGNIQEIDVENPLNIQRAKLKIETRKWLLSKVLPQVYGDKIEVKHDISEDMAARLVAAKARIDRLQPNLPMPVQQIEGEIVTLTKQLSDGTLQIDVRLEGDA